MLIILKTLDFLLNPLVKYVMNKNRIRRIIANDIAISAEWTELLVSPPFTTKNNFQAVLLHIEGCWNSFPSKDADVRLANGTIINPKVEIIDEYGNTLFLKPGMSFGIPADDCEKFMISELGFRRNLSKDRKYTTVRIASEQPFLCNIVSLYDYNLK
jgi:hypothetical protein